MTTLLHLRSLGVHLASVSCNMPHTKPVPAQVGDWTVLKQLDNRGKGKNTYWLCRCSCGKEQAVSGTKLRNGETSKCQSCSCRINGRKGLDSKAKGDLYVIRCGPYYKIGHSDNPERRLKDMRSANPYPFTIHRLLRGQGDTEPEVLDLLKTLAPESYHRGEWFKGGACEL